MKGLKALFYMGLNGILFGINIVTPRSILR